MRFAAALDIHDPVSKHPVGSFPSRCRTGKRRVVAAGRAHPTVYTCAVPNGWPGWLLMNPKAPPRCRSGLLCEPGRCFCQDLLLLTEDPVLPTQPSKYLPLSSGQTLPLAIIYPGLVDPVADGLMGRLELPAQLFNAPTGSHQANHLRSVLSRIRLSRSRHETLLLGQRIPNVKEESGRVDEVCYGVHDFLFLSDGLWSEWEWSHLPLLARD